VESTAVMRDEGAGRLVPEPPFDTVVGLARQVAISGLAGLFTGILVGGIGGRLFMRLAGAAASGAAQGRGTEAGFTVGEVTLGGSLALVIFIGIFTGIAGAILFVVFAPWLSWARHWRGFLFGVVLFGAASATSDIMNPDNIDFRILKNPVLLVSAIFVLFLVFGLVMDSSFRFLDRRLPRTEGRGGIIAAPYVTLALVGLLVFVVFMPLFFTEGACDCEPPVFASSSIVLAGLGTVLWWATALFSSIPTASRRVAAVLGYAGLAGVLAFGLFRAFSDAIEIIG
jgi:hypothetical protein